MGKDVQIRIQSFICGCVCKIPLWVIFDTNLFKTSVACVENQIGTIWMSPIFLPHSLPFLSRRWGGTAAKEK